MPAEMNSKIMQVNPSGKRLSERNKNVVVHNGSFITEAFSAKAQDAYEDPEGLSMDGCLRYPVYTEPNAAVVSTEEITPDHEISLESGVIQAEELASVDQLFSICNDHSKGTSTDAVAISKHDTNMPYNDDSSIVTDSMQLSEASNTLISNDAACYSSNPVSSSCDGLHSQAYLGTNKSIEMTTGGAAASVYPKISEISSVSSPISIISTCDNLWSKTPHPITAQKAVPAPELLVAKSGSHEINGTLISNTFEPCVLEDSTTDSTKEDMDGANQIEYVSGLLTLNSTSNVETAKIHSEDPLHIVNAVATADGAIELVGSDGRTFRLHPHTDIQSGSHSSSQHVVDAESTSAIVEQLDGEQTIQLLEEPPDDTSPHLKQQQNKEGHVQLAQLHNELPSTAEQKDSPQVTNPLVVKSPALNKCKGGLVPAGRRRGGWPKGKKRKANKFRIKAPKTAYLLFAKKRRRELMIENPNYSFSEVTVIMGKDWTALETKVKQEYVKLAEQDQARFNRELKDYQQTEEYQTLLKRKRDETSAKLGGAMEEDLGYVEEEYTLFCHICNQRFSSRHNRKEHLAGRVHLKNLESELRKQLEPAPSDPTSTALENENEPAQKQAECCKHCVNRVIGAAEGGGSVDVSLDINTHMESFLYKHSQRELELEMLRENAKRLKEVNSQLSKDLITTQETIVKLKQEIQSNKQWQMQLAASIDNLKMVPTLFGVINF